MTNDNEGDRAMNERVEDDEFRALQDECYALRDELAAETARLNLLVSIRTPTFVQTTNEKGDVAWVLIDDSQFDEMKPAGWDEPKAYSTPREAIDAHLTARKTGANPYI